MRDYIIMTDSCCDLSQQEVEELELTVLPLSFTIEGIIFNASQWLIKFCFCSFPTSQIV